MSSKDHFPETPSQPHATVLLDQRDVNEQLVLSALRAHEDAQEAHSSRMIAEDESGVLRVRAAELVATAEFRELLLGIIGHDLRNPLNTILVAAQLLTKRDTTLGKDDWLVSRIVDSGQRMRRMIDQLANFTRARLGGGFDLHLVDCDAGEICQGAIVELRLSSGVEIHLTTTGALGGRWDVDRLAAVFSNLIGNATGHAKAGTPVLVAARDEGNSVVVDVRNEGDCIPPEILSSIFGAFRRGQSQDARDDGHLGLGLYISREIALSHRGTLEAESHDGVTMFSLRLPRVPPS